MNKVMTMASVAALGLAVAACGGKGGQGDAGTTLGDNSGMMTSNEALMSDGMATNGSADNATAAPAGAMDGKSFADAAAKSDAMEIAAAKLAEKMGSDKSVKDFAAMMIKAHTDSTAKIKKAAAAASPAITPDPTLKADQQAKLDDLKTKKGADFDKAYGAGQVAAHEEALATMQGYAATGDVPSLKTAAGEIAPVVQSHLDMAKKLPM